ncbi:response regulator transcription factor [bacterium]|nr:response regulator transcription factor [bacterium]
MEASITSIEYKVLLIEDNSGDARLLEMTLDKVTEKHASNIRFNVRWVNLLETGIQYLRLQDYQLVFLDLSLPDSNGLHSIEDIVAEARKAPVIVLSGTMDQTLYDDVLDHGAQGYVLKGDLTADKLLLILKSTMIGF